MRSDDDMPGEGFYERYRVLFYPWIHERPAARMRDVRREKRAVLALKAGDIHDHLEAAALADGLTKCSQIAL